MTGFDETVPPELDPPELDPSADGTSADNSTDNSIDNVIKPEGGPESVEADDEDAPAPMSGDDDLLSGHLGE